MHAVIDLLASFVVALAATAFAHLGLTLETEPRRSQEPVIERTIDRRETAVEKRMTERTRVVTESRRADEITRIC